MSQQTSESRVAKAFGLEGDKWLRHANPASVWTRFAIMPVLAVAIWSYDWIGWWSLVPTGLILVFLMINPLLFHEPSSTRNWASKAVFGERIWADRNKVEMMGVAGDRTQLSKNDGVVSYSTIISVTADPSPPSPKLGVSDPISYTLDQTVPPMLPADTR